MKAPFLGLVVWSGFKIFCDMGAKLKRLVNKLEGNSRIVKLGVELRGFVLAGYVGVCAQLTLV